MKHLWLLALLPGAMLTAAEPPVTKFSTPEEQMKYYRQDYPMSEYPPELVSSGKTTPKFREVMDFESMDGWKLTSQKGASELRKTAETKVFGQYAAEIILKDKSSASFELVPPTPVPMKDNENGLMLWGRLIQYSYSGGPVYKLGVRIIDAKGKKHQVFFPSMALQFKMWGCNVMRLPNTTAQMPRPWKLEAVIGSIIPREKIAPPYFILLDSLQLFHDDLTAPTDVPHLPIPKPTVATTICPPLTAPVENTVASRGRSATFTSKRGDSVIQYTIRPKVGDFSDLKVTVNGKEVKPFVDGGPVFEMEKELLKPGGDYINVTLKKAELKDNVYRTTFQARSNVGGDGYTDELSDYTISYSMVNRSLVISVESKQGNVAEINFGTAEADEAKLMPIPYLRIDPNGAKVLIGKDFYMTAISDPWISDATKIYGNKESINGGIRYENLTSGKRNPVKERIFLNISDEFSEVLPNLANPPSPYIKKYASACWRWGMTEYDWQPTLYWLGVRDFQFRSHADMHRDINESYGFLATDAPSRGEGFARNLRDKLVANGFGYAPYNCYIDQNPYADEFHPRNLRRTSTGQVSGYHQTPASAQRLQEKYAPDFVKRLEPTFSYLDVHGCREPWRNPDMRTKSWLAGRYRAEFLGNAALMLRNREIFNGPCFTEGGCNWIYAGFYDVIYGYLGHGASYLDFPDIVDFSLLRIKPLATQTGMGDWGMYYRGKVAANDDFYLRRFVAATLAYGHAAWLDADKARMYFLTNAIQRHYIGVPVKTIEYSDGTRLMPTSEAFHTDALDKGFIHVAYENGTEVYANLNRNNEAWEVNGRTIPAHGFYAVAPEGNAEAFSLDFDYVVSPEYIYLRGRDNNPVEHGNIKMASGGVVFRPDGDKKFLCYPQTTFRNLEFDPAKLGLADAAEYSVKLFDLKGNVIGEQTIAKTDGVIRIAKPAYKAVCYEFNCR